MSAAIERGAEVDAADAVERTPPHHAALLNNVEEIDVLVEAGANIEARNGLGCTPLHLAASESAVAALLALLKHGPHINAQDRCQFTPLRSATAVAGFEGDTEVVDSLLRSGADETILDSEGRAAVDMISWEVAGLHLSGEQDDRVRDLLVNAQADRAWHRRRYLVLCRTHPDRADSGVARATCNETEELED
ncbi:unnamed protein product [Ectocarpus sp. CCAP 1310/34]|nr:unnamed protein product [Ectocarpus sp. CCAP 1310/34]